VSPQWTLFLRFSHQDPMHNSTLPIHATCPTHLILLDVITRTILGDISALVRLYGLSTTNK
jgi:hypothetical protein